MSLTASNVRDFPDGSPDLDLDGTPFLVSASY
jgi:hypothetical protein